MGGVVGISLVVCCMSILGFGFVFMIVLLLFLLL